MSCHQVRDYGYAQSKLKQPSGPGLYESCGADCCVSSQGPLSDFAARVRIPDLGPDCALEAEASPVPQHLVVNLQVRRSGSVGSRGGALGGGTPRGRLDAPQWEGTLAHRPPLFLVALRSQCRPRRCSEVRRKVKPWASRRSTPCTTFGSKPPPHMPSINSKRLTVTLTQALPPLHHNRHTPP